MAAQVVVGQRLAWMFVNHPLHFLLKECQLTEERVAETEIEMYPKHVGTKAQRFIELAKCGERVSSVQFD